MEKSTVKGFMFIIPNYVINKNSFIDEEGWELFLKLNSRDLENFGMSAENTPLLQIWAGNDDVDNFACHQEAFTKMVGKEMIFPNNLPYEIIKDLKEGDTLTLESEGVTFELKVEQLGHRYERFGRFEEVRDSLVPAV